MALDPVVNFFRSTIATLPVASGGTSIVITTGDGAKLPDPAVDGNFNLTIYNEDDPFDAPEIVRVTAISGDTLTVTRAQEGTSATNKTSGNTWYLELTPTAKTIQDIDTAKLDVADVVNNLTSTDTDKALSANQGKVLQDGKLNLSGGTMTGDLTIPDKIIHSGDTNTAIRFPSADTVAVETNGVERVRVTSAGDVGIGTTDPATKLDVSGAIRANNIFTLTADVASPTFNIDYDAFTLPAPTGNKGQIWIVTAIANGGSDYRAFGYVFQSHSGSFYINNYINLNSANLTLSLSSTSSATPIVRVKDIASGGAGNFRVSAVCVTKIG